MERAFGNDDAADICWVAPTTVMNPLLPAAVIDEAMAKDPQRARAEYLSLWREDLSDFIPADAIEASTDWDVRERPREGDVVRYVAITDAAGGAGSDRFTLAIAHRRSDGVAVLDVLRERLPRFVPAAVISEFCELLEASAFTRCGATASQAVGRGRVRAQRRAVRAFAKTKSEIYLAALPLLLAGRVRLSTTSGCGGSSAGLSGGCTRAAANR